MPTLAEKIADAEAELARLKREAAHATCADLGHDWVSLGGCNAGCHADCVCSVPVLSCRRCGNCDYGDNKWARETRRECADLYGDPADRFSDKMPIVDVGDELHQILADALSANHQ